MSDDLAFQLFLEHFTRPENAGLHGSQGDIEDFRNFFVAFFFAVS